MKVTIVPIVIDAFGTVTKGLIKGLKDLEIGGRVETIQTTALLFDGMSTLVDHLTLKLSLLENSIGII